MINRDKLIITILPIIFLMMDLVFNLSSQLGERNLFLCLFLGIWMVLWWIFEVLPLGVTALIPLFFLPFFGISSIKEVTPSYSNPVIFLFLGGFIIARALEKTQLDERIALNILKRTGRSDSGIVLGFVIATAFLSMWISNTATTVMMVPIAMSVGHFLKANLSKDAQTSLPALNTVLFLSIAYSANIGGIMTPVGTPPNVVFIGYLEDIYGRNVDFYKWILATAPLAITLLYIMTHLLKWIYPYQVTLPKNFPKFINEKLTALGDLNTQQKVTITVFLLAASLWVFKGAIHYLSGFSFLNDTSIAIMCGVLLFLIPTTNQGWQPVLKKDDISHLPWDIVLLFGGGMALASALKTVGLIQIATDFFGRLDLTQPYLLIFILAALTLTLTEIMSNVALCVVALPLIMKLGEAQGIDPLLIAMPATLCASFAFSMPISTPPNAIVFGTNQVTVKQMLKAGALLNFLAVLLTMSLGYILVKTVIL